MASKKKPEQAETKNWGVPNWREAKGYPPSWGQLNKHQQKWEFLRRSSAYRHDWERYENADMAITQERLAKLYASIYDLKKFVNPRTSWQDFHEAFIPVAAKGCNGYPIIKESQDFLSSMGYLSSDLMLTEWDKKLEKLAEQMAAPRDIYGLIVNVEFNLEYSAHDQAMLVKIRLEKMQEVRKALMATLKVPRNRYYDDDYQPVTIRERNRRPNKKARDKSIVDENHLLLLRVFDAHNAGVKKKADIIDALTEDGTLSNSWDESTISRKIAYVQTLWQRM